MSIRTKVLGMVDVMMRVPPILVIDEILKIDMGWPSSGGGGGGGGSGASSLGATVTDAVTVEDAAGVVESIVSPASGGVGGAGVLSQSFGGLVDEFAKDTHISDLLGLTLVKFLICLLGLICALCIVMLWTRHLVMVYMFVISLGLTFLSHWSNVSALAIMENSPCILEDVLSMNTTRLLDTGSVVVAIAPHVVAQWFMGMLFAYIHLGPRYTILQKAMPVIFASPIILATLPLKPRMLKYLPLVADAVPLMLTKITLLISAMDAGKTVYNGYQYAMNFVSNFGLSALIENEWQRLNVPSVLRVFWTIRITQGFVSMMLRDEVNTTNILPTLQTLLVDGCGTLTAVLGMTSVISVISHYIGKAFQWYLLTFDNEEEKSLGTVSAVLFYILALQTGLTSLAPDKRFVRLCRNLSLLITALLHFIHNIVSPILMSLSAARNPSRKRHFRALTVCAFLVLAPICLLVALWRRHSPSTWLLAVTAFSVEVVVKVLVSLATYTLFLLDACRQTFWEKLDDYLYYVRAFGNSIEFCFGILLFFNGAWILVFESGGAIRAIMMCIHAYFNIWCEARAGWSVFMKRRSAVHKISTLPEATPAQLHAFDDVCAICYQEMHSAKITRCRHFFHGVCLRKWLYVQDRCPLCHEIMMYTDRTDVTDPNAIQQQEQAAPVPIRNREDNALDNRSRSTDENNSSSSTSASLLSSSSGSSATAAVGSVSSSLGSSNYTMASTTAHPSQTAANSTSASTTSTTAAVATAAASNTTHSFRFSPDLDVQD
ncbi:protein TRC8 homolog isoform X2 [Stomoxys calcitrans]|uniref:RING-type domain-containing protein n=1 Tax=Stomoxys calcitrans TaxID=35570 RepID=A0A1I8PH05_STOCA|nr:protein TRC8 homolog isoform X2 [Stomoxys calcitrans]